MKCDYSDQVEKYRAELKKQRKYEIIIGAIFSVLVLSGIGALFIMFMRAI